MNHYLTYGISAVALILVLAAFVLAFVKIWQGLSVTQRQHIEHMAARAVLLIEQQAKEYFDSPDGQTKRKLAVDLLAGWVNKRLHTQFTPEQLESFVQEAFDKSGLKHEFAEVQNKVVEAAKEGEPVG